MSENRNFFNKVVGFSLGVWVRYIINFLAAPIITRLFLPEEYGQITLFITYATLFSSISFLGMDQVFVRFYSEPPSNKSKDYLFTFCLLVGVAASFLIGLVIIEANDFISVKIVGDSDPVVAIWLFLYVLTLVVYRYISLLYRVQSNVKDFTIITILGAICSRGALIVAGIRNPTYELVIPLMVISSLGVCIWYLFKIRKNIDLNFKLPKVGFIRETSRYAAPIIPSVILTWVSNSMALILLNKYSTIEEVGIYSAAAALASTVLVIKAGFDTYWAPYVYENYKNENNNFWMVHKFISIGMIFFTIAMVSLQVPIALLLGAEYREAMKFFPFLLISPICYTIAETTGVGIGISKKTYWNTSIMLVTVTANFLLCILLIPKFAGAGAALASGISAVIYLMIKTIIGEKYYKVVKNHFYIVATVVSLFVISFINYYFYYSDGVKYAMLLTVAVVLAIIFRKEFHMFYIEIKKFRR